MHSNHLFLHHCCCSAISISITKPHLLTDSSTIDFSESISDSSLGIELKVSFDWSSSASSGFFLKFPWPVRLPTTLTMVTFIAISKPKGKAKTGLHGLPMYGFCGCVALSKPSSYSFALQTSMSFRDLPRKTIKLPFVTTFHLAVKELKQIVIENMLL